MATDERSGVLDRLRQIAIRQDGGDLSDGQLLDTFLKHKDDAAFEGLVRRHGPMVLGVCRRVLNDPHAAEDAFQATFLVLVRKAASVLPRQRVGNWLYGVAYRTALEARKMANRRRSKERQLDPLPEAVAEPQTVPDWKPLLDKELSRLADKYRVPIVLCDLEGRGRKDVAGQLGIPEGTLSSRLATGRRMLAQRLSRYGLAVTAAGLTTLLAEASADLPSQLVRTTVQATRLILAGATASAVVSAPVAGLTERVLRIMLLNKIKTLASVLLGVGFLAGLFLFFGPNQSDAQPPAPKPQARPDEPAKPAPLDEFYKLYSLKEGEVLKRIGTPYPACRMEYYRTKHAHQAENIPAGPTVMLFRWEDGKLRNWGMTFTDKDGGENLSSMMRSLIGVYGQEMEGDNELLAQKFQGDFIMRLGAPREKLLAQLEEIMRTECKMPVRFRFRDVERKVYVASGEYRYNPLEGRRDNEIDIYGRQLVKDSGAGGGSGTFDEFLGWVGMFIDRRVVSDVKTPPTAKLDWRYHRRSPSTAEMAAEDTDPATVLHNVGQQTGLTFKEETRKVRVLFVDREE